MTMKTKTICFLLLVCFLASCNDFLKESSQDEIRPSLVGELEQMFIGNGYEESCDFYCCTDIFTDDIKSYRVSSEANRVYYDEQRWLFAWDNLMFTDAEAGYYACLWEEPYRKILGCNLVLDNLDNMYGEPDEKARLRGEALTLRAWYYLQLVNLFGVAYNQGDPETDLGVPLKLNSTVTGESFARNTVGEVYEQIESDLLRGNYLLTMYDDGNYDVFRMGHLAAKAILSRMYLYMEEWDKAAIYADSVLQEQNALIDLNDLSYGSFSSWGEESVYDRYDLKEAIWARSGMSSEIEVGISAVWGELPPFFASNELGDTYEHATYEDVNAKEIWDLRGYFYFIWLEDFATGVTQRVTISKSMYNYGGIRTAEVYLNRAEANAQKFLRDGKDEDRRAALADLNELRKYRINEDFYSEVDITDGQELLDFCLAERRKELCGETNHRWCDIRRYGINVTHVSVEEGGAEYVKDMSKYALPIPEMVLDQNKKLEQNSNLD